MKSPNKEVLEAVLAFGKKHRMNQVGLAEFLGEPNSATITNWKSRGLPDSKVLHVANKIGYAVQANLKAQSSMDMTAYLEPAGRIVETRLDDDDKVFVSRVRGARFAAGSGELMFEAEEIDQSHGFRKDYMQRRGLQAERCKLFNVKGESMLPTLQDGGLVLVNLADREVVTGKVYALVFDDGLRVKRLFRRPDGLIEMRSDNPMQHIYPPEPIMDGSAAVIGRVVWQAGDM